MKKTMSYGTAKTLLQAADYNINRIENDEIISIPVFDKVSVSISRNIYPRSECSVCAPGFRIAVPMKHMHDLAYVASVACRAVNGRLGE